MCRPPRLPGRDRRDADRERVPLSSPTLSIFKLGPFSNRLILLGVLAEVAIILLIVYTDLGNALFGTAPVASEVWLFVVPFALAMLAMEEARKGWCAGVERSLAQGHRGSV